MMSLQHGSMANGQEKRMEDEGKRKAPETKFQGRRRDFA